MNPENLQGGLYVALPTLLAPRQKFNPSRMGTDDRRQYEQEVEFARVNLPRLRAECRIAREVLG